MNQSLKTGISVAAAAAALFAMTAPLGTASAADAATVKCTGANSCKGSSECKTAKNDCKGKNSCKGQGWVSKKDEKECKAAGGSVAK
ncbi:MAG: hypothetical protein JO006_10630 [Paucibacter sp.]|nr:hypothetical protein [Roseateles sp.]